MVLHRQSWLPVVLQHRPEMHLRLRDKFRVLKAGLGGNLVSLHAIIYAHATPRCTHATHQYRLSGSTRNKHDPICIKRDTHTPSAPPRPLRSTSSPPRQSQCTLERRAPVACDTVGARRSKWSAEVQLRRRGEYAVYMQHAVYTVCSVHRTSRSDAKTRRCGALPLRSRAHSASSSSSPMHRLAT